MDLYEGTRQYFNQLRPVVDWPELNTILSKRLDTRPGCWLIPVTTCQAAGGNVESTIPAIAAIACLQTAIILVDDLLDADGRMESQQLGPGEVANLAAAFQSLGLECIFQSPYPSHTQQRMLAALNRMLLDTALGQALDLHTPDTEAGYWRNAQAKSSPFFRSAFQIGVLAIADVSAEAYQVVSRLGHLYGEMIQISDDLHDAFEVPAGSDWLEMRNPLPILFAQVVAHPWRARFLDLRQKIRQPEALAEAQTILIRCGAVSYCIDQIMQRYQVATGWLKEAGLQNAALIGAEFSRLMAPIQVILAHAEGVQNPV